MWCRTGAHPNGMHQRPLAYAGLADQDDIDVAADKIAGRELFARGRA